MGSSSRWRTSATATPCRGRHHRPEVRLRVAEGQVAVAVGAVGAQQRQRPGDGVLQHVVAPAEASAPPCRPPGRCPRPPACRRPGCRRRPRVSARRSCPAGSPPARCGPRRAGARTRWARAPAPRAALHCTATHQPGLDQQVGDGEAVRRRVDHQREVARAELAQRAGSGCWGSPRRRSPGSAPWPRPEPRRSPRPPWPRACRSPWTSPVPLPPTVAAAATPVNRPPSPRAAAVRCSRVRDGADDRARDATTEDALLLHWSPRSAVRAQGDGGRARARPRRTPAVRAHPGRHRLRINPQSRLPTLDSTTAPRSRQPRHLRDLDTLQRAALFRGGPARSWRCAPGAGRRHAGHRARLAGGAGAPEAGARKVHRRLPAQDAASWTRWRRTWPGPGRHRADPMRWRWATWTSASREAWREGRPRLAAWHEGVASRPSLQETLPREG